MKKFWLLMTIFFFGFGMVYAQAGFDAARTIADVDTLGETANADNAFPGVVADTDSLVTRMDAAVRAQANELNRILIGLEAQKIIVNQFVLNQQTPPLASYWINQLTEEMVNIPNRTFNVLSTGASGAEFIISGEIVEVANVVRVYTRLVNVSDRTIEAAIHSDFERNQQLIEMLRYEDRSSASSGSRDMYEPDSWDNPVHYEIGEDENVPVMSRTIHDGDDEDFFLLIPDRDGMLTVETTGDLDTYMYLYDYDTEEQLQRNDDGGQGTNARIRYSVQAGVRYLAQVRGYSSSATGSYNFRAYLTPPREGASSWNNPLSYEIGFGEDFPVVNLELVDDDDEHYILLVPQRDGRLVIETTGYEVDTYMYLYDYETRELLDENDDGGQGYNSRIRYIAEGGTSYMVKICGYGSGDTGTYGFRAYFQGEGLLPPDEFEPDNEPSNANWVEIGTSQQHTFHSADDVDWVRFQITQPGSYVIRTRGVRSNSLDTYIELFDANLKAIAEDDDGGSNMDSRLLLHFDSGIYYLKVWCIDDEPDQAYNITIIAD